MMNDTAAKLNIVVDALRESGYDPYVQIYGYLKTGDETYITRRNDAREIIKSISKEDLNLFVVANNERLNDQ